MCIFPIVGKLPLSKYDYIKEGLLIIKDQAVLLIFAVLIINITLTKILYIPPMDIEIAKALASNSMTGGLGFYIISISSELNVFIFCLLLGGILYKVIESIKHILKEFQFQS